MPRGRPLKYPTVDDMQKIIDQYFIDCEGKVLNDQEGNPMIDKWGNPIIIGDRPPTITGLALALGLNSRQALLNYQGRAEFNDTITRAKTRVEAYAEERLFDKDGANGAKFSLANNFANWADKRDIDLGNKDNKPFEISDADKIINEYLSRNGK